VNLAVAWQRSGWVRGYAGDPDGAIESLGKAIRLNPLDPRAFLTQSAMAFAHFIAGRDDESARAAAMALRIKPNWLPALRMTIASNAMRGEAEEVKRALNVYLGVDPEVSITRLCEYYPFRRKADRQRFTAAMNKAGVPK
jgi:tetratricopeptide (TPR) repeat protein